MNKLLLKILNSNITVCVFAVFIILIIAIGSWKIKTVKKRVSYELMYKSMVEETVRDMVKPEYLIDDKIYYKR